MSKAPIRRTDSIRAAVVEKGIMLQERVGTELAAKFLKENNVNFDVVLRVLNRPRQRRNFS